MNVLYISYDGALDPLGYSQIIPYIISLSREGIKFTLLTFEKKDKLKEHGALQSLKNNLAKENIKWETLLYHKSPTVLATAFDVFTGIVKGFNIARRDDIQLIHARSFVGAIPALLLAKVLRDKFVFDMRGFWPDERVDGEIWNGKSPLYKISKWFEKIFLLKADWNVCLTEEAKIILEKLPYLRKMGVLIDVIPTCVDTTKFIAREKDAGLLEDLNLQDRFVVLYFGEVGTWYMLDEMIDFFKIAKRINPASFFLILTIQEHLALDRMIQKKIEQADYFIKNIPYEEMPSWISLADVSVSFIKPLYSKKSSCPTKFAESLACGIPVVINSGIGDTDTFVRTYEIGVVVENFVEEEYIKAVKRLFELLKNKNNIKKNSRKIAEEFFSLESGVEKYKKIYQKFS
ncbi:MAG: glycosyltransferase [Candidatus Omnitrophica bacterium]|nr:glycosyltransferase [Candidatus Omnitrophota bacterium]